jgi:preprotein translocase subunit SecE
MGEQKSAVSLWQEVLQPGLYKRNQGRIARQVTFAFAAVIALLIAWRFSQTEWVAPTRLFSGSNYLIPSVIGLLGLWLSYRLVNISRFADFLIAVEAEMNKVSWPSRGELIRSSLVVIGVIVILAGCLYLFDFLWRLLFQLLGIVYSG